MKLRKKIPVFFPPGSPGSPELNGIVTDPFGSYTGVPAGTIEYPVQDADDL